MLALALAVFLFFETALCLFLFISNSCLFFPKNRKMKTFCSQTKEWPSTHSLSQKWQCRAISRVGQAVGRMNATSAQYVLGPQPTVVKEPCSIIFPGITTSSRMPAVAPRAVAQAVAAVVIAAGPAASSQCPGGALRLFARPTEAARVDPPLVMSIGPASSAAVCAEACATAGPDCAGFAFERKRGRCELSLPGSARDDSCRWSLERTCDEPSGDCPAGTDCTDCDNCDVARSGLAPAMKSWSHYTRSSGDGRCGSRPPSPPPAGAPSVARPPYCPGSDPLANFKPGNPGFKVPDTAKHPLVKIKAVPRVAQCALLCVLEKKLRGCRGFDYQLDRQVCRLTTAPRRKRVAALDSYTVYYSLADACPPAALASPPSAPPTRAAVTARPGRHTTQSSSTTATKEMWVYGDCPEPLARFLGLRGVKRPRKEAFQKVPDTRDADSCAALCLERQHSSGCISFDFNSNSGYCNLYNVPGTIQKAGKHYSMCVLTPRRRTRPTVPPCVQIWGYEARGRLASSARKAAGALFDPIRKPVLITWTVLTSDHGFAKGTSSVLLVALAAAPAVHCTASKCQRGQAAPET